MVYDLSLLLWLLFGAEWLGKAKLGSVGGGQGGRPLQKNSAWTRWLDVAALEESGQLARHFVGGFDNIELC